jgi:putative DNA-invertase from lambdoid prophage Rac
MDGGRILVLVAAMSNAALWARVSTLYQDEENQLPAMRQFAEHHGHTVKLTYRLNDASAFTGKHREVLATALDDAYRGEYKVLIVWAIDRISREGIEEVLKLYRQFRERGVTLVSVQEPWLNGSDATVELLTAVSAWVAKQESVRRSERVKAGLAARRAKGLPVGGRVAGAKDRKPRKRRSATEGTGRP